jgi:hypothetical protein
MERVAQKKRRQKTKVSGLALTMPCEVEKGGQVLGRVVGVSRVW